MRFCAEFYGEGFGREGLAPVVTSVATAIPPLLLSITP